jgi:HD-GYP domain-containing protein (c-di-GMP phosphodiesterase class II)
MTMKLVARFDFSDDELVHIKRGALLHDIGKMGIPDSILLKPGPLTDDEWTVMRMHPTFAYRLLSHIPYLQPALDIPYRHHERWNGAGYPSGQKGEEIPLPARIFAVVDVWDALLSDRPYRPAWPQEAVITYLKEQSGIQFDPTVIDIFLTLLSDDGSD